MLPKVPGINGAPTAALLAAIVESSDDAIASKTLDGIVTSWNRGAERLFGYAAAEIVGRPIAILAAPGREDEMPAILARIRRGERVDHFETVRRRKDGGLVEVSLTVSPVRNQQGRIVGASKVARDIRARKAAEEQQRLLLQELSHRVKNTLAVVQSLARQSGERAGSVTSFLEVFGGRLRALAGAHELLAGTSWSGAGLGDLVRQALEPHAVGEEQIAVAVDKGVAVPASLTQDLALVLHELATNAAKHGALSVPGGQVAIDGGVAAVVGAGGREVQLVWREAGGPPVERPARLGFGTLFLSQAVAHGHGGRVDLDWRREGLVCAIRVPLDGEGPARISAAGRDGPEASS
jgi:PAS domain S-box-containing protein